MYSSIAGKKRAIFIFLSVIYANGYDFACDDPITIQRPAVRKPSFLKKDLQLLSLIVPAIFKSMPTK